MVTGEGRSGDYGALANNLLNLDCVDAVFSVQYRLSGYGKVNPFLAALQDILTAYIYLRNSCKIPARSLVIAGNSSGANIAVALVRYFQEFMPRLGPLCALWACRRGSAAGIVGARLLSKQAPELHHRVCGGLFSQVGCENLPTAPWRDGRCLALHHLAWPAFQDGRAYPRNLG